MSKPPLTPEQFEKKQRDKITAQEKVISLNLAEIARLEDRLAEVTSCPSEENIGEALDLRVEIQSRRAVAEDFRRNFRADAQYQKLLNNEEGKIVLVEFLKAKRLVVAGIERQIPDLRREAMQKEDAGDESHYELNDRADDLRELAKAYEGVLSTAEQAISRFPATTYREIIDRLYTVIP